MSGHWLGVDYEPDPAGTGAWRYRVHAPRPERAPDGGTTAQAFDLGATLIVQLGTRLGLEPDEQRELAATIAQRHGLAAPPPLLADWPAVDHVVLSLAPRVPDTGSASPTATSDATELARSTSSGLPPFVAVLHATLDGPLADTVRATLAGHGGRLVVAYALGSGSLLSGDATPWFRITRASGAS